MAASDDGKDFYTEALIVGGGMGGVYSLHRFRKEGYQVKLVEAGSYFGGVWYHNRYPGARVDSECPLYQLNIPEVWKHWNWSERFPGHKELREYYKYCDDVLGLSKDCIFNTVVDGVTWKDGIWTCRTRNGRSITCKYLLLCTGSSYKKYYPDFPGLNKFKGTLVHSAVYPDEGIDVKGKKVGLVGNGATGVQILQELGKEDCELTTFIRTPNIALPMQQRKVTVAEQENQKTYYKVLLEGGRHARTGFPNNAWGDLWKDTTHEERMARIEESWQRGGFAVLLSTYSEFLLDKEVNAVFYDFWKNKVRARITDKAKADIVAPEKQEHYFGIKRPSLEQDYYEVLDRPNVKLVNLKKASIREFTEKGIVTEDDKLYEFDIIILATGYDSMTGSLMDINIHDREGKLLQDKWKSSVETYLGLMIHGMPNMFMTYSPQAPTALSNGPPVIESQVEWIILALKKIKEEGIEAIDPQDKPAKQWRQAIQDLNNMTLHPLENSWYMGANVPGKVREQLVYVGGVDQYNKEIAAALDGWKGFDVIKAQKGEVKSAA